MTWAEYVSALAALLAMSQQITNAAAAAPSTNADFNTILPRCVEFAELYMQRDPDLDFLSMRETVSSVTCTADSRTLLTPAAMVIPLKLNIITPAGSTPDEGTRHPVQFVSRDFLDMMFATVAPTSSPSVPLYAAVLAENEVTLVKTFVLGPTPDDDYVAEWYGTVRQAPLTSVNTQTFISTWLPDLFLSASMIFMSGYQRNFGAQSDDPKMANSWGNLFNEQKHGAAVEEARKKAQSSGWTAYAPTSVATPPRQ